MQSLKIALLDTFGDLVQEPSVVSLPSGSKLSQLTLEMGTTGPSLMLAFNLSSADEAYESTQVIVMNDFGLNYPELAQRSVRDFVISRGHQVSAVAKMVNLGNDLVLLAGASSDGAAIATVELAHAGEMVNESHANLNVQLN